MAQLKVKAHTLTETSTVLAVFHSSFVFSKAEILPVTWNSDIHNNFFSATLAHIKFFISDDICNEL